MDVDGADAEGAYVTIAAVRNGPNAADGGMTEWLSDRKKLERALAAAPRSGNAHLQEIRPHTLIGSRLTLVTPQGEEEPDGWPAPPRLAA